MAIKHVNKGVIVDKRSIEFHLQLLTHHFNLIFCLLVRSSWLWWAELPTNGE